MNINDEIVSFLFRVAEAIVIGYIVYLLNTARVKIPALILTIRESMKKLDYIYSETVKNSSKKSE